MFSSYSICTNGFCEQHGCVLSSLTCVSVIETTEKTLIQVFKFLCSALSTVLSLWFGVQFHSCVSVCTFIYPNTIQEYVTNSSKSYTAIYNIPLEKHNYVRAADF